MNRLLQVLFMAPWISLFSKKHIRIVALKPNKDLEYINRLFEKGQLRPVIDGPYSFDDTVKAFRLFGNAEHKGKIVITV